MSMELRARRRLGILVFACTLPFVTATAAPQETEPASYRIGAGDVLQVFVWKEPELSREVTVRPDGNLSVPLLGEVLAAGRSPGDLSRELQERLARYVAAPVVTVSLSQANSARFFVIGQVATPGGFPLTGQITVLQGLALAGGFREFAKTDRILVVRQGGGKASPFITVNYKRFEDGAELSKNVLLQAGDTILVP